MKNFKKRIGEFRIGGLSLHLYTKIINRVFGVCTQIDSVREDESGWGDIRVVAYSQYFEIGHNYYNIKSVDNSRVRFEKCEQDEMVIYNHKGRYDV